MSNENDEFRETLLLRVAICEAALNRNPDPLDFLLDLTRVGVSVSGGIVDSRISWNLIQLNTESACPMERVSVVPWLIEGMCGLTNDRNYPIETLNPAMIIANLRDVVNKAIPADSLTPRMFEIIDKMEEGAAAMKQKHPALEQEICKALRIKGMAIDDEMAGNGHHEYSHYDRKAS